MVNDTASSAKTPWPYTHAIPQRFSVRYQHYLRLGGLVDVTEDARAYAGEEPIRDIERLMFLSLAFDQIHKEGLDGDFAELGVYQGSTAAVLARYARRLNRQLYLLDTYEGFDQRDLGGPDSGRRVAFTDTSLDAVRARVGIANTSYIKGYFPQTADQLPDEGQYCLVHIDADLYAPIMSGLEYFYPRMVPGGFLIIHDYGSLVWEGAEKAVDFFFADKPESVIQIPDSSGSAVVRRVRPPGKGPSWIGKRQFLAPDVWHSAADGRLSNVLIEGWSSPEQWGIWGVGPLHQIRLMVDLSAGHSIAVDVDVHAFVWDDVAGRRVGIFLNGQRFSDVTFTKAQGIVSISIFLEAADGGLVAIEFRPRLVVIPKEVDPTIDDPRSLGVALHRIRVRSAL